MRIEKKAGNRQCSLSYASAILFRTVYFTPQCPSHRGLEGENPGQLRSLVESNTGIIL